MPYKKKLAKKRKLSPSALAYLTDGEAPGKDMGSLWCFRHGMPGFFEDEVSPKELWEKYRNEFLPEFIEKNPGRRPLPWWQWDGQPRQRIGGTGTPDYEVLNHVPHFVKGIPTGWVAIDPNDPPVYESEAAYLLRHKLLTDSEQQFIKKHPELLEPQIFLYEDEKE